MVMMRRSKTRKTSQNSHQASLLAPAYIEEELQNIHVLYREHVRYVKCFCGKTVRASILPHLRKVHPVVWRRWAKEFVRLRNSEYSYKRIMNRFRANDRLLFTWRVIEREIMKAAEQGAIKVWEKSKIDAWEPTNFKLEQTTVWDFQNRGEWAVHRSDYRGNWSPQIPRNLILKFTAPKDIVLDPFVGGGTTLIETWLTNRLGIGLDVSPHAIHTSTARIAELHEKDAHLLTPALDPEYRPIIIRGDSRDSVQLVTEVLRQRGLENCEVDLICAHPPYMDSLRYSEAVDSDLSRIDNVDDFSREMGKVAVQLYQLLKTGGICAVLIGDIRKNGNVVPLGLKIAHQFTEANFKIKDIIVKLQHRDMSTGFYYNKSVDYRIAHESLYLFRK